jgi:hypothetical protein
MNSEFNGTLDPKWDLTREMPWHRWAAFAFALGATAKDVARKLGKSEPAVQNLLRQKWFQREVTSLMAEYGSKDIMKMLQAEQIDSLLTLVELRDNPRVSSATRFQCAKDILDRGLGKPVQRVENIPPAASDDPVAEVERLEQEVLHLRRFSNLERAGEACTSEERAPCASEPFGASETSEQACTSEDQAT